nr:LTA synthase family protein [Oceanisphaera pacifica]
MNIFRTLLLLLSATVLSKIALSALNPFLAEQLFSHSGAYSLWWGLRLDITAVMVMATPAVLLLLIAHWGNWRPRLVKLWLLLACFWLIVTTTADAIYMLEAGRHVTFEVFTGQGLEQGLLATAVTTYLPQTFTALILVLLFAWLTWRLPITAAPAPCRYARMIGGALVLVLWLGGTVTAVRGGWSDAPQSPMSAYKVGEPEQALIAWNAPYAISYYLAKGKKRAAQQITPAPTAQELALLAKHFAQQPQLQLPSKQANVLIVLLESWPAADLASYLPLDTEQGPKSAAPYFDALRQQSITTNALYADGYRTVEGMFATFCSFANPIGGGVAGTQLQSAPYQCLPQILKEQGFDTHFIQGSGKGIVGSFAQSLGFTHSYGKKDYPFAGTENYWGYMDDDIYRFTLDKLAQAEQPFLITVNTGTTHDTYLPNDSDYVFGKDNRSALRRNVIHHADGALQRFLEQLPKVLDEPTLVVLMADHTAGVTQHDLDRNAIPFAMFATDGSLPVQKLPLNAGQLDIAPTIMDWLGGSVPWFTGQSLLTQPYQGFAHYSAGQTVNWIQGQHLVRFDVTQDVSLEHNARCFTIADNGIKLHQAQCAQAPYADMLSLAQAYTRYTQSLLFKGKTSEFAESLSSSSTVASQ